VYRMDLRERARIVGRVGALIKFAELPMGSRLRFAVGKSGTAKSSMSGTAAELIDDKEDSSSLSDFRPGVPVAWKGDSVAVNV
jgi:hypothetical protein